MYAANEACVEELLRVSSAYLDWFKEALGGDVISLQELRQAYQSARRPN
jgi:hypothetical protein